MKRESAAQKRRRQKQERLERDIRRRNIARAMVIIWDSSRSHMADAVHAQRGIGNEEWNAKCVREYHEVLYTLGVEGHELAKIDFPVVNESLRAEI